MWSIRVLSADCGLDSVDAALSYENWLLPRAQRYYSICGWLFHENQQIFKNIRHLTKLLFEKKFFRGTLELLSASLAAGISRLACLPPELYTRPALLAKNHALIENIRFYINHLTFTHFSTHILTDLNQVASLAINGEKI